MPESTDSSMLPRFEGQEGMRNLVSVLERQSIVNGDSNLARLLAERVTLHEVEKGHLLMEQGGVDTDLIFILSGNVKVMINKREVCIKTCGTHVGEMSLIDQMVRRSATVIANEKCTLAKITEREFCEIAEQHPKLWRSVAIELCKQLRDRTSIFKEPNVQPVIFIGSSVEGIEIAREIESQFQHDRFIPQIWDKDIFRESQTTIESLMNLLEAVDFAILVISKDDIVNSRGVSHGAPRDNIIFEMGLFMGGIGRNRTIVVCPRGSDIKIPTDMLGVHMLDYESEETTSISSRLGPVCTTARRHIKRMGPR